MRTRVKVYKTMLEAYLLGVNRAMQEANSFWNIEVKQHGTQADCVWVILG